MGRADRRGGRPRWRGDGRFDIARGCRLPAKRVARAANSLASSTFSVSSSKRPADGSSPAAGAAWKPLMTTRSNARGDGGPAGAAPSCVASASAIVLASNRRFRPPARRWRSRMRFPRAAPAPRGSLPDRSGAANARACKAASRGLGFSAHRSRRQPRRRPNCPAAAKTPIPRRRKRTYAKHIIRDKGLKLRFGRYGRRR